MAVLLTGVRRPGGPAGKALVSKGTVGEYTMVRRPVSTVCWRCDQVIPPLRRHLEAIIHNPFIPAERVAVCGDCVREVAATGVNTGLEGLCCWPCGLHGGADPRSLGILVMAAGLTVLDVLPLF